MTRTGMCLLAVAMAIAGCGGGSSGGDDNGGGSDLANLGISPSQDANKGRSFSNSVPDIHIDYYSLARPAGTGNLLDGDGDLDLIINRTRDGDDDWFPWIRIQDIDGDGELDFGPDNTGFVWDFYFRNDGSGSFTRTGL